MDDQQWRSYVNSSLGAAAIETTFERVHGGYMNSTIRLEVGSRDAPSPLPALDGFAPRSAILKHYPPYMNTWPEAPLDPKRSMAEYEALRLFRNGSAFRELSAEVGILIPRPLWYDESHNVLWIEDMGHCADLQTALSSLSTDALSHLGRRLGRFLAAFQLATMGPAFAMHSRSYDRAPASSSALPEHEERMISTFKESSDARLLDIHKLMAALNMAECPIIGVPHRDLQSKETCYGLGDIWPSSFLVLSDPGSLQMASSSIPFPRLALIDWEFMAPTYPSTELASLAARFCTVHVGPQTNSVRRGDPPAATVAREMVDAYLTRIRDSPIQIMIKTALWRRRATSAWARALMNLAVGRAKIGDLGGFRPVEEAIACLTEEDNRLATGSLHPVLVRCLGA